MDRREAIELQIEKVWDHGGAVDELTIRAAVDPGETMWALREIRTRVQTVRMHLLEIIELESKDSE